MDLWSVFLLILVIGLVQIVYVIYWIPKWLLWIGDVYCPTIITRRKGPDIILTIDDVPYSSNGNSITEILALLELYKVRAILFVLSGHVAGASQKQLLVEAVKRGHVLGNHGRTDCMHARLSKNQLRQEILHCDTLIEEIYALAGVERMCRVYRPGSGIVTPSILSLVKELHYELLLGSVYPHDPLIRSSIWNAWFIKQKLEPGSIIILHDRNWTPALLERILPWIRSHKFSYTTSPCSILVHE